MRWKTGVLATGVACAMLSAGSAGAVSPENSVLRAKAERPRPAGEAAQAAPVMGGSTGLQALLVEDINPGAPSSTPVGWAEYRGERYFAAVDASESYGLFKLTKAGGVVKVSAVNTPVEFTLYLGELYFTGTMPDVGRELFKVTKEGKVVLAADLNPEGDGNPRNLVVFNGSLYLSALRPDGEEVLLKLNARGDVDLVDITNPIWWGNVNIEHNAELYFGAQRADVGWELFKMTRDGRVVLVGDINPGAEGSSFPYALTSFNKELYFDALGPTGFELYKVDRSGEVVLVADINPTGSSEPGYPGGYAPYKGELYFKAYGGSDVGAELYKLGKDGKVALVADLNPANDEDPLRPPIYSGPDYFTAWRGELYFQTYAGKDIGRELYKVGRGGTVTLVADIETVSETGSDPVFFTPYRGGLLFNAFRTDVGFELFKLDPSGKVTLVADINPSGSSDPYPFDRRRSFTINWWGTGTYPAFRNSLYMVATGGSDIGRELYKLGSAKN